MTPRRLTERPQARSAARHASEPMATPRFAVFSSLLFNRWDPCKPSQNVSADMPSTTKSGSQDSTASRAGNNSPAALAELRRLQKASGQARAEMMKGTDAAYKSMQQAFESARKKFERK